MPVGAAKRPCVFSPGSMHRVEAGDNIAYGIKLTGVADRMLHKGQPRTLKTLSWEGIMRSACISRRALLALALSCGVFASFAPASAQDASMPLKGETVRIYVGFSPGGGYDAYARMLAPHFEKRTGATVVVENRPGGMGLTALNQMVRGKTDGLTMMMLNGEGAILGQLTKQAGVAFDMAKVAIYARVTDEQHLFLVRPGMPDSLKEILASGTKVKFSATGRPDNLGDYAAVTCEALQ